LADASYELLKVDPSHPSLHFKKIGKYRTVLRFYANLNDCDAKRAECQDALQARAGKRLEAPSPVCDVYLDSMEATLKCGQRLLAKLDTLR
jgi:hypothetical protein